eukprot:gene13578-28825_t
MTARNILLCCILILLDSLGSGYLEKYVSYERYTVSRRVELLAFNSNKDLEDNIVVKNSSRSRIFDLKTIKRKVSNGEKSAMNEKRFEELQAKLHKLEVIVRTDKALNKNKKNLIDSLITVEAFTKNVSACKNNLELNLEQKEFVDLDRVVENVLTIVYEQLPIVTSANNYRVPPLALVRFARGGKTTTISRVFDKLKKDCRVHPIIITFNGNGLTPFSRRFGETQSQAILRLIAVQLGDYTPEQAQHLVVDREALDRHLGDNVVLLIDELNELGFPLLDDAAMLLRNMFLDRARRFLVFTSHYPVSIEVNKFMTRDFLGKLENMTSSPRGVSIVNMSVAKTMSDFQKLRVMSRECEALTEQRAAWLGYIPSLIYSIMNDIGLVGVMTLSERFKQIVIAIKPDQEVDVFQRFVRQLLTGDRDPVVGEYYSAFQSVGKDSKVSYPLCYIKEILWQLKGYGKPVKVLLDILNKLESHLDSTNSGMEWECSVRIAIVLQMLAAKVSGLGGPFDLVAVGTKPNLAFHTLPAECCTVKAASTLMANIIAEYEIPTLIYMDSANAQFPEVEGFVVYTSGDPTTAKTVGFQAKKSDEKPRKDMDTNLINGGAVLIRGRVTAKKPRKPKNGWHYMTFTEVRDFLGHSLLLAMPRDKT